MPCRDKDEFWIALPAIVQWSPTSEPQRGVGIRFQFVFAVPPRLPRRRLCALRAFAVEPDADVAGFEIARADAEHGVDFGHLRVLNSPLEL